MKKRVFKFCISSTSGDQHGDSTHHTPVKPSHIEILATQIEEHIKNKSYTALEQVLKQNFIFPEVISRSSYSSNGGDHSSGEWWESEYETHEVSPVIEVLFFEHNKKFRELFCSEQISTSEYSKLFATLVVSLESTSLVPSQLFELNNEMKLTIKNKLDQMWAYAKTLEKASPTKYAAAKEIHQQLLNKLQQFKTSEENLTSECFNKKHQAWNSYLLENDTMQTSLKIDLSKKMQDETKGEFDIIQANVQPTKERQTRQSNVIQQIDTEYSQKIAQLDPWKEKFRILKLKLELMETLHIKDKIFNEHRGWGIMRHLINALSVIIFPITCINKAATGHWLFFNKTTSQEKISHVDAALGFDPESPLQEEPSDIARTLV